MTKFGFGDNVKIMISENVPMYGLDEELQDWSNRQAIGMIEGPCAIDNVYRVRIENYIYSIDGRLLMRLKYD